MPQTTKMISCVALLALGLSACASDQDNANAAWAACTNVADWHNCLNQHYAQLSAQSARQDAAADIIGYALLNTASAYAASRQASQPIFIGCSRTGPMINCIGQ